MEIRFRQIIMLMAFALFVLFALGEDGTESKQPTPISETKGTPATVPGSTPQFPSVIISTTPSPLEIIVGIVNDRCLTKDQLNRKVDKIMQSRKGVADKELYAVERRSYEGQLLYDWADIALLAVEAESKGITVTTEEINQDLEKLKQTSEGSVDINVALQRIGLQREEFYQEMRDAILGDKLIRGHINEFYPEPKLRQLYEQRRPFFIHPAAVRASHIFKSIQPNTPAKQKKELFKEMQEIRERINNGEAFENLAEESDAFSRSHGGDLGWLEAKNFLPHEVSKELFRMKVGEVSKVIESGLGYHIIKVTDFRPPQGNTFEEAREAVIGTVYEDVRKRLLNSLRSRHTIILNAGGISEQLLNKAAIKH